MKKIVFFLFVLIGVTGSFLMGPCVVSARGDGSISTAVIDAQTFITVKEGVSGDVLSLYRIKGDRIILVDSVVNTTSRSSSNIKLPDRFLHRLSVENR